MLVTINKVPFDEIGSVTKGSLTGKQISQLSTVTDNLMKSWGRRRRKHTRTRRGGVRSRKRRIKKTQRMREERKAEE